MTRYWDNIGNTIPDAVKMQVAERAMRNKLLGLKIAKALHLEGEAADQYADQIVEFGMFAGGNDDALIQVLLMDLKSNPNHDP